MLMRADCEKTGLSTAMNANGKVIMVTAVFFLLPSVVFAQTDNARYLGDSIPVTMIPGFTYNVAVTMKNTGTTTWTGDAGYKLWCTAGYNFEVYHNEAGLGGSETIAPGQDRTFEMSFLAPSAGTYTTSWKMVKEGVGAFGEPCTKQVVVTFGPNIPSAPTINSPATGMIMGSNRPDVRFQGDPCDAYEVHISSCNLPTSSDGWDSGVVWINSGPNELLAAPGVLNAQATYYVFARLHNTNGWGPSSAYGNWFYTAGQLVNDPYFVAGQTGTQRAHYMCYNPDRNEYLVCYFDSSKGKPSVVSYFRLDAAGTKIGAEMWLSNNLEGVYDYNGTLGPRVCYNSSRHEYLIAWTGYLANGLVEVDVQRIEAATGATIGGNVCIRSGGREEGVRVEYSPRSNSYLLTWTDYGVSPQGIQAIRLDSTATPIGSLFNISANQTSGSYYPAISYNSVNDAFLVVFQVNSEATNPPRWWDLYAQRVRASDGACWGRISLSPRQPTSTATAMSLTTVI